MIKIQMSRMSVMKIFAGIVFVLLFVRDSFSQEPSLDWIREYRMSDSNRNYNYFTDMVHDSSGNIYVTGWAEKLFVLKYNSKGNLLWNRAFSNEISLIRPKKIRVDSFGNVYIAGNTPASWYLVKYDSRGNLLWFWKKQGWALNNNINTLEVTDTSVYIAGGIQEQFGPNRIEFRTIKFTPTGDTLWSRRVNNPYFNSLDEAMVLKIDPAGNVVVTGRLSTGIKTSDKHVIVKYSSNGELKWYKEFEQPEIRFSQPVDMKISDENNIYISSRSAGYDYNYRSDICTIKYDSLGNLIWYRIFTSPPFISEDGPRESILDDQENIYITGYWSLPGEDYNFCTLKYDKMGKLLWSRSYNNSKINRWEFSESITLDEKNNIYVTGSSDNTTYSSEVTTIKYDTDGNSLWVKKYPPNPIGNYWGGGKIGINKNNDIIIAGNGFRYSDTNTIIFTMKYSNPVNVSQISMETPEGFQLFQNYPNPFNPSTTITFSLPTYQYTVLSVFDILGREVAVLVNEKLNAGTYNYQFSIDNYQLKSGVYFYKLEAGNFVQTRKMLLIK